MTLEIGLLLAFLCAVVFGVGFIFGVFWTADQVGDRLRREVDAGRLSMDQASDLADVRR